MNNNFNENAEITKTIHNGYDTHSAEPQGVKYNPQIRDTIINANSSTPIISGTIQCALINVANRKPIQFTIP